MLVNFDVAQDRGLDPAVGKIKARSCGTVALVAIPPVPMLELCGRKLHRRGIAVSGQPVDNGPARISQPQQLRNFVEGFAGSVVAGVADVLVRPVLVPLARPGKDECARPKPPKPAREISSRRLSFCALFEQHGMNVSFEVIDCDQGLVEGEGQCLGVSDSDQQGASQARVPASPPARQWIDKSVPHRPAPCEPPAQSPSDAPAKPAREPRRHKAGARRSARRRHSRPLSRPNTPPPQQSRRRSFQCRECKRQPWSPV